MDDQHDGVTAKKAQRAPRQQTEFAPSVAKEKFLAALARRGIVAVAARAAHISRETAYRWREEDAEFKAAWADALTTACETLEAEAWRRAAKGTLKPVYQGGVKVGDIREYSDTLLIFLLKANNPGKFRENQAVEHTGGVTVKVEHVNDWRRMTIIGSE